MKDQLESYYGYLFEPELLHEIEQVGKQGEQLLEIGDTMSVMPLLLDGAIKILREDEKGDELLLYFIEQGDTCAMTFSCCIGNKKSEIRAIAETDTHLILIPIQYLDSWMANYKSWQKFVLESYHTRVVELLETVDTLAFMRMDERLLRHLQDKAKVIHNDVIQTTHQDIAYDLHTSRVVISRLLKKLEQEGKIRLQRNQIQLIAL